MGCVKVRMTDQRPLDTNIKVGNGESFIGNTKGDINMIYIDLEIKREYKINLTNYTHTEKIKYNLYRKPYAVKLDAKVRMVSGQIQVPKS